MRRRCLKKLRRAARRQLRVAAEFERLAAEHLNIDCAYCSLNGGKKAKGAALAVIKVNDLAKAQRVLSENGAVRKKSAFRRPVLSR